MTAPGTVQTFPQPDGSVLTRTWSNNVDAQGNSIGYGDSYAPAAGSQLDNLGTLQSRALSALTANANYLAIPSPTQAQAIAQVATLTKECNGIIRLLLGALDSVANT